MMPRNGLLVPMPVLLSDTATPDLPMPPSLSNLPRFQMNTCCVDVRSHFIYIIDNEPPYSANDVLHVDDITRVEAERHSDGLNQRSTIHPLYRI
eukprot:PDM70967.1 hypothetical protein PRIPAC_44363 [Pristionchus pacificus]